MYIMINDIQWYKMMGDLYIIKIHILDSKFNLEDSNKSNNSKA